MKIVIDDLAGPQIAEFLSAHLQEMRETSPPESTHALDISALRKPDVTFWSAWENDQIVGCGALKTLDPDHAELKSMRTAPAQKRTGVASRLLAHIISEAQRMGYSRLSLETGSFEFFTPARRLYEKFGFEECPPFAAYVEDPNSVFMTRVL